MFLGCIPAHAAYFSLYEQVKSMTGADQPGHHPVTMCTMLFKSVDLSYCVKVGAAAAGALASMAHDSILTPMDVCKQRLQLGRHVGVLSCIRDVIHLTIASVLTLESHSRCVLPRELGHSFVHFLPQWR